MSRRDFRNAARDQLVCAVSGRGGPFHAHHVVRENDVAPDVGDPHDPRNALRLSLPVHFAHHSKLVRVPLSALLDTNIDFAFGLLGAYAYDYLRRHYGGEDLRLEASLVVEQSRITSAQLASFREWRLHG